MKSLCVFTIGLACAAAAAQTWPPAPSGFEYKWYLVPINTSGYYQASVDLLGPVRSPNPSSSSELLDMATFLDGGRVGYESEYPAAANFWYGQSSYMAAAWLSLGASSTAYGHAFQPQTAEGTASFLAGHRYWFAFIWYVDKNSSTTYHGHKYTVFTSRTANRDLDSNGYSVSQITSFTTRLYLLNSSAISLSSTKGLNGSHYGMSYTAVGSAAAFGGVSGSIDADDEVTPLWQPDYSDYDQIASNANGVQVFDVQMVRQPTTGSDTHYKFLGILKIQLEGPMLAQAYAKKVTASGANPAPSEFEAWDQQQPPPVRLSGPTASLAYAKHRIRFFDMRSYALNSATVAAYAQCYGSDSYYDSVTYTILNDADVVVYETTRPDEVDVQLPVLDGDGDYTLVMSADGYESENATFSAEGASVEDLGSFVLYPTLKSVLSRPLFAKRNLHFEQTSVSLKNVAQPTDR